MLLVPEIAAQDLCATAPDKPLTPLDLRKEAVLDIEQLKLGLLEPLGRVEHLIGSVYLKVSGLEGAITIAKSGVAHLYKLRAGALKLIQDRVLE